MPSESNDQTSILLQVLASLRGDMVDIRGSLSEVKAELVAHGVKLEQVLRQATLTNGRVSDLERRNLHDDGYADGRKAERDRMYAVARIASKPVTWAVGGVIGAVGYIVKDRAG